MIKCPKCGSTAQVKVICGDNLNDIHSASLNWINMHLKCGCGCRFYVSWIQEGMFIER